MALNTKDMIRLKCVEIAINGCAKNGIARLEALPLAEKIYDFVVEIPNKSKTLPGEKASISSAGKSKEGTTS